MKHANLIPLLLTPLLLASNGLAQLADWHAIQSLPAGTKIHVQLKHGSIFGHCFFEGAPRDELVCTRRTGYFSHIESYPRNNIKAVYRTHNTVAIGIGVGAGTGAVLGATRSSCCRGSHAVIGAGFLALGGAFVGMVADPFVHGRAVYRGPNSGQAPKSASVIQQNMDPADQGIPCLRDGITLRCATPATAMREAAQTDPSTAEQPPRFP